MGGTILENCALRGIAISESIGAALELHYLDKQSSIENDKDGGDNQSNDDIITTKLVLDCMGNASPISRQQRFGRKPDGVCAVVGTCAGGFEKETNLIGDIIYTNTEIQVLTKRDKATAMMRMASVLMNRDFNTFGKPSRSELVEVMVWSRVRAMSRRHTCSRTWMPRRVVRHYLRLWMIIGNSCRSISHPLPMSKRIWM